jgi:phage gp36-like protein
MAAYATIQDLTDRFGAAELVYHTDKASPPTGAPDADALGRALGDAAAVIDSYLSSRYRLPLAQVDPVLTKIACDLARANYQGDAIERDGVVVANQKAALAALRDLADGRSRLQAEGVPAAVSGGVAFASAGRAFPSGSLADY